jgi:hypothetical protein
MGVQYVEGDLFTSPDPALAHCVSADFHMSAGIAARFQERFGHRTYLQTVPSAIGDVVAVPAGPLVIFYLVTKARYYHRPTYGALWTTLSALRRQCVLLGIRRVSVPRLGCGLDHLEWSKVRALIRRIFHGDEVEVTVYHL